MAFAVFILVNATLLIRPAEVVPALDSLPIYYVLMVSGLAMTFGRLTEQVRWTSLRENPITACVTGLFGMVILSNLVRFDFPLLKESGIEFLKVVLYYLMLVAVVTTPDRIRSFLRWLGFCALVNATLALLQYHGYLDLPALKVLERVDYDDEGQASVTLQLRSVGIYNDPNDLCLILGTGFVIVLYQVVEGRGLLRFLWVGPLITFLYALILTRSRGGFLALLISLFCLFVNRFGVKRAIPLGAMAVCGLMVVSGGRQTEISVGQGTAQERMEKWKEGLILFTHRPVTGIGVWRYSEEVGLVAHNSYVHAYVEMGFPGGSLFVGLFYFASEGLRARYYRNPRVRDPAFLRLRPYIVALIAGYGMGIFSLSRNYIVPTYVIFGIATAYHRIAANPLESLDFVLDQNQCKRLLMTSVGVLAAIKTFLLVAAH